MSDHAGFGWALLILGLVLAGVGLVWILAPSIPWLGRLPGDIRIERDNSRFYFPLVTCLLLSLVLSLVVWLIRLLRG
jgi:cell division protein FtsW (lipid II flippase)